MRLMTAVAMRTLEAGGPGSGRYPKGSSGSAGQTTYNPGVNTEHPFHQTLMDHDFEHTGSASRSHYYKGAYGDAATNRTPPEGKAGKAHGNAAWTVGHGIVLGTDRYKRTPTWHDSGDSNRHGESTESLAAHLHNVGWHKHGD